MTETIVLGSGSPHRRQLLENAGVPVEVVRPEVDERAVEAACADTGVTAAELAEILALAKGQDVSSRMPGRLVIASDQTMVLGERLFHKPSDMEEARRHLLALSGKTHELHSAVVVVRDGQMLWSHVATASLTMRPLDPAFVGRHLSRVGDRALTSVGAYQIEGEGIQLFDSIRGDHFTIVGMPMLPLLAKLRELGVIDG